MLTEHRSTTHQGLSQSRIRSQPPGRPSTGTSCSCDPSGRSAQEPRKLHTTAGRANARRPFCSWQAVSTRQAPNSSASPEPRNHPRSGEGRRPRPPSVRRPTSSCDNLPTRRLSGDRSAADLALLCEGTARTTRRPGALSMAPFSTGDRGGGGHAEKLPELRTRPLNRCGAAGPAHRRWPTDGGGDPASRQPSGHHPPERQAATAKPSFVKQSTVKRPGVLREKSRTEGRTAKRDEAAGTRAGGGREAAAGGRLRAPTDLMTTPRPGAGGRLGDSFDDYDAADRALQRPPRLGLSYLRAAVAVRQGEGASHPGVSPLSVRAGDLHVCPDARRSQRLDRTRRAAPDGPVRTLPRLGRRLAERLGRRMSLPRRAGAGQDHRRRARHPRLVASAIGGNGSSGRTPRSLLDADRCRRPAGLLAGCRAVGRRQPGLLGPSRATAAPLVVAAHEQERPWGRPPATAPGTRKERTTVTPHDGTCVSVARVSTAARPRRPIKLGLLSAAVVSYRHDHVRTIRWSIVAT